MKFPRPSTLRIELPIGQTVALAVLILSLLIAALEGLSRLPWIDSHTPTAIGSSHPDLNVKFGELDALLKREGRIDCIFVGSSMVYRGINPAVFVQSYRQQTGEDIVCYNFGVRVSRASSVGPLSKILVKRYHPRLLVYGFSLRDLTGDTFDEQQQQQVILNTPWVQYQLDSFNVTGWLIDQSTALRHFLAFRDWLLAAAHDPSAEPVGPSYLGYAPFTIRTGTALLKASRPLKFSFTRTQLNGLKYFLSLRTQTQLLLVEMPASYRLVSTVKGERATFRDFVYQARDLIAGYGVPVLTTIDLNLIPDSGWSDTYHLHEEGANIFSQWLGEQVGTAVKTGELAPLTG